MYRCCKEMLPVGPHWPNNFAVTFNYKAVYLFGMIIYIYVQLSRGLKLSSFYVKQGSRKLCGLGFIIDLYFWYLVCIVYCIQLLCQVTEQER